MSEVTRFAVRVKVDLRESLLGAAAELLAANGYRGLRMVDVGAAAGVSRQTVYNEFGDKEQLAQAVLLRCTAEFLTAIDSAMQDAVGPRDGLRAGALAALEHAEREPLIIALVTGGSAGAAGDLLPFLADRHAEPVLDTAAEHVSRHLRRLAPDGDHQLVATAVVRLVVSHMLLPTASVVDAAAEVADVAVAALRR